jgi:competence protein ComEC
MRRLIPLILLFTTIKGFAGTSITTIVDVGSGHCAITKTSDNKFFVFDAGHWQGQHCYKAAKRIIKNNPIELMILSHSDSDHIGDAARILNHFKVKTLYRVGTPRKTKTWARMVEALYSAKKRGLTEYNLQNSPLIPGTTIQIGEATVTLIYGKEEWTNLSSSENNNAVSIVAKYELNNHSILFTGDTIGRRLNDHKDSC